LGSLNWKWRARQEDYGVEISTRLMKPTQIPDARVRIEYSEERAPMKSVRLSGPPKARLPGRSGTSSTPISLPARLKIQT
jgi:hypothetical protein